MMALRWFVLLLQLPYMLAFLVSVPRLHGGGHFVSNINSNVNVNQLSSASTTSDFLLALASIAKTDVSGAKRKDRSSPTSPTPSTSYELTEVYTGVKRFAASASDEQMSLLIHTLARIEGVTNQALVDHGVWQVVESRLQTVLLPSAAAQSNSLQGGGDGEAENEKSERVLSELLQGLSDLQIRWRTLDMRVRLSIEPLLLGALQARLWMSSGNNNSSSSALVMASKLSSRSKAFLCSTIVHLGALRVSFPELSQGTQSMLKQAVLVCLQTPTPLTMSSIVFALGNMQVDLHRDFDALQRRRIKVRILT